MTITLPILGDGARKILSDACSSKIGIIPMIAGGYFILDAVSALPRIQSQRGGSEECRKAKTLQTLNTIHVINVLGTSLLTAIALAFALRNSSMQQVANLSIRGSLIATGVMGVVGKVGLALIERLAFQHSK